MDDIAICKSVLQSFFSLNRTCASVQEPPKSIFSLLLALQSFKEVLGSLAEEAARASEKFGKLKLSLKQLGKEIATCETIINENRSNRSNLETQLDSRREKIHIHVSAISVELQPRYLANVTGLPDLDDSLRAINVKLQDVIHQEIKIIQEYNGFDVGMRGVVGRTGSAGGRHQTLDDLRNTRSLLEEERTALENSLNIFVSAGKKVLLSETTEPISASSDQTSDKEPGLRVSISREGRKTILDKDTDVPAGSRQVHVSTTPGSQDHPSTNVTRRLGAIQIAGSMSDSALLRELEVQMAERQNYKDAEHQAMPNIQPREDVSVETAESDWEIVTNESVRADQSDESTIQPASKVDEIKAEIKAGSVKPDADIPVGLSAQTVLEVPSDANHSSANTDLNKEEHRDAIPMRNTWTTGNQPEGQTRGVVYQNIHLPSNYVEIDVETERGRLKWSGKASEFKGFMNQPRATTNGGSNVSDGRPVTPGKSSTTNIIIDTADRTVCQKKCDLQSGHSLLMAIDAGSERLAREMVESGAD
ncbi:hypothetical protein O988_05794, partial [Pseudogymnoascus sp. VKM F-3808]